MGVYNISNFNSINVVNNFGIFDSQPTIINLNEGGSIVNVSQAAFAIDEVPAIGLWSQSFLTINGNVTHFNSGRVDPSLRGAIQFGNNFDARSDGSVITIGSTGSIYSYQDYGIWTYSSQTGSFEPIAITVNNAGTIQTTGGYAAIKSYALTLNNSGVCGDVKVATSATVSNSGTLSGIGITNTAAAGFLKLHNTSTGTISGTIAWIGGSFDIVNDGQIFRMTGEHGVLVNRGAIGDLVADTATVASPDFVVTNTGTISRINTRGDGTFIYHGENGSLAGAAFLGRSTNEFYGGAGSENVYGGFGSHTVDLAGGNDKFQVVERLGSGTVDGGSGVDTIIGTFFIDDQGTLIYDALVFDLGNGTIEDAATGELRYNISNFENVVAGGANDTIIGNGLGNRIDGGVGADSMSGGAGNDIYFVDNPGDVVLEVAGQGRDYVYTSVSHTLRAGQEIEALVANSITGTALINLTGNEFSQSINGNAAINTINGLGGNDSLRGFAGADTLNGGVGNDFLIGGVGADVFFFNTALNAATNVDTITDFTVADDLIRLENTGVGLFNTVSAGPLTAAAFWRGAAAHDATDRIIYNPATGGLFYDADGTGAIAAIKFAQLSANLALTNLHFSVI